MESIITLLDENLHQHVIEYITMLALVQRSGNLDDTIHNAVGSYAKFSKKEIDKMNNTIRKVTFND